LVVVALLTEIRLGLSSVSIAFLLSILALEAGAVLLLVLVVDLVEEVDLVVLLDFGADLVVYVGLGADLVLLVGFGADLVVFVGLGAGLHLIGNGGGDLVLVLVGFLALVFVVFDLQVLRHEEWHALAFGPNGVNFLHASLQPHDLIYLSLFSFNLSFIVWYLSLKCLTRFLRWLLRSL
jgi:hypothetical protein